MTMQKYKIKESVLKTVTSEKNPYAYISKVKGHLNRAYDILNKNISGITDKIKGFSADNKVLEIDVEVLSEIQELKDKLNDNEKRLVSHVYTSLNNVINGKGGNSVNKVW